MNSLFYRLAVSLTNPKGKNKTLINPIIYEYYQKKMNEQFKTKRMALKSVERLLMNVLWVMMTYKRNYINPPV